MLWCLPRAESLPDALWLLQVCLQQPRAGCCDALPPRLPSALWRSLASASGVRFALCALSCCLCAQGCSRQVEEEEEEEVCSIAFGRRLLRCPVPPLCVCSWFCWAGNLCPEPSAVLPWCEPEAGVSAVRVWTASTQTGFGWKRPFKILQHSHSLPLPGLVLTHGAQHPASASLKHPQG